MSKAIGQISGNVYTSFTTVKPIGPRPFRVGDELAFGPSPTSLRAGFAIVRSVDGDILTFDHPLNVMVPAVSSRDLVFEYERPCTRCECIRCRRERVERR